MTVAKRRVPSNRCRNCLAVPSYFFFHSNRGGNRVRGYRASDVATASRCHRPSITIGSPSDPSDHHFTATEGVTRCEGTEQATSQLPRGVIVHLTPFHHHLITAWGPRRTCCACRRAIIRSLTAGCDYAGSRPAAHAHDEGREGCAGPREHA